MGVGRKFVVRNDRRKVWFIRVPVKSIDVIINWMEIFARLGRCCDGPMMSSYFGNEAANLNQLLTLDITII